MTNKKIGAFAKLLVVVLPLVLLLASITLSQIYFTGDPPASQNTPQLKLVGYGNCCNSSEPSLTLTNLGNENLTILKVISNGEPLIQGVLGGGVPLLAVNNTSSFCEAPTNGLIFPQAQHWNMDTGGLCSATILPGEDATLYLGVLSNNQSLIVQMVTNEGNCTFTL